MKPILDPRNGDFEDDASSTKQRNFISLAGSLLSEISFPKLAVAWMLLVGFPSLLLGAMPIVVSIWLGSVLSKTAGIFTEIGPALLLAPLATLGWFAGRPLLRLAETSFWSLNALAIQPTYVAFREGLRHLAERLLASGMPDARRASVRAATAAAAGGVVFALGLSVTVLVWPVSRWMVRLPDLISPYGWLTIILANSVVLISSYLAMASLIWGCADAMMPQPRNLGAYAQTSKGWTWRVAHLSDIHTVGERYGFRLESGRSGPRGNERLRRALAHLDRIHAAQPLDAVLITGDLTDAGRSAEWAEFFDALAEYPRLAERVIALPGNHDLNVVDRASPARMELPTSSHETAPPGPNDIGARNAARNSVTGHRARGASTRPHARRRVEAPCRRHGRLCGQRNGPAIKVDGQIVDISVSSRSAARERRPPRNHRAELEC